MGCKSNLFPSPKFQALSGWGSYPGCGPYYVPGKTAQPLLRFQDRAVSQRKRSLVPREARPQSPKSLFSAPTDRRPTKHCPDPIRQLGNLELLICKARLGALSSVHYAKTAHLLALTLSSLQLPPPPSSLRPPLPPLPQAGCRSWSYFLSLQQPLARCRKWSYP